jgi:peptide/nickel transport system ATP-binding protein
VLGSTSMTCASMRKRMQMIFQDPFASLNPRMTSARRSPSPAEHKLATRSEAREKVADLLRRVGLSPDMAALPARVLRRPAPAHLHRPRAALEPKLIVADEAVSALDVSVKAQVVNLMLDLQARA